MLCAAESPGCSSPTSSTSSRVPRGGPSLFSGAVIGLFTYGSWATVLAPCHRPGSSRCRDLDLLRILATDRIPLGAKQQVRQAVPLHHSRLSPPIDDPYRLVMPPAAGSHRGRVLFIFDGLSFALDPWFDASWPGSFRDFAGYINYDLTHYGRIM